MASKTDSATIATRGKEHRVHVANTLAPLFVDDPVIKFLQSSLSAEARRAYMPEYFQTLIKAAALNSVSFEEANDWQCTAVWLPPGKRVDNFWTLWPAGFVGCLMKLGVAGCKKMLVDYQSASDKCKARALNGVKSYHYLFFIGTSPEARGQGLASQVVRKKQIQARKEGVPIWLEATTERSRRVYEKCGFETVGSFVLGKGNFAADGEREVGGPGAEVWAMLWKPEKSETVESNGGS